jgi:pyruvate/2-oxoglutarate dehydrogenase complex dihydrolipoamide dehydrogenase (E3) component
VYALGDIHPGPQFTHLAYDDYRIVRDALLHGRKRSARERPLPYCVFTDPPMARIGLSEGQAKEKNVPYRVATMPIRTIGRAQHTSKSLASGRCSSAKTTGCWAPPCSAPKPAKSWPPFK